MGVSYYTDVATARADVGDAHGHLWPGTYPPTWWEIPTYLEQNGIGYTIPNSWRSTIIGNHVATSNHYRDLAIDLVGPNGNRANMSPIKNALRSFAEAGYLSELYYNDGTANFQYGRRIGAIANHYDHVHIALYPNRHLPVSDAVKPTIYPQEDYPMQSPIIGPGKQWSFTAYIGPAPGGLFRQAWLTCKFPDEKGGVADWILTDTNGTWLQYSDSRNSRPGYFQVGNQPEQTKGAGVIELRDAAGRPDKGQGPRIISAFVVNNGTTPCV